MPNTGTFGGVKPLLVNPQEMATDRLLFAAARDSGDRLQTKVRLADVVDVNGLTGRPKQYALAAHLDFVMVDSETSIPRFAVEFDGKQHFSDATARERDQLKDTICEAAGLPLLRITSEFTRLRGQQQVLAYVVEAFYLSEAFFAAQQAGTIPWDELFDPGAVLVKDSHSRLVFNTLDSGARLRMLQHWQNGRLPAPSPDVFVTGSPAAGAVNAHAWLAVTPNRYLIAKSRIRDFRFRGITPSDVVEQLAVAEVGDLVEQWLNDEPVLSDRRRLAAEMREVQNAVEADQFLRMAGNSGALRAGGDTPRIIHITNKSRRAR